MHWMLLPLRRYADFKGRSRRREYWMFVLLVMAVVAAAGLAMIATAGSFASEREMQTRFTVWAGFALLPLIVPLIAVTVRRLHDLGLSGWWLLAFFVAGAIPMIDTLAALAQIIVMALPGRKADNRFGTDPKAPPA
ncbi:DUF805 domain-containing protein [Sphingomonas sp. S1-29]|uniref:DUF805 domain-containing protein n=1 Tax=Sphingomonas sp. S1-29 TaxID=2991074 RepID=UPI00223F8351|nr:DUF805 domain-containing protein [Sphingomonas sp. S1-29]UZK68651.1 DUF805 domain-containing protein [Sphingomonas sp. S1-29]